MKKRLIGAILGACALALAAEGVVSAQATASDRSPLLEFHGVRRTINLGPIASVSYTSDTLLVYKDGFTLRSLASNDIPSLHPFVAHVAQGAVPAAFTVLEQALQSNQVGLQSGDCVVGSIPGDYDYQVTWYGKESRLSSVRVSNSFTEECPDEVRNIVLAIGTYEAALP